MEDPGVPFKFVEFFESWESAGVSGTAGELAGSLSNFDSCETVSTGDSGGIPFGFFTGGHNEIVVENQPMLLVEWATGMPFVKLLL